MTKTPKLNLAARTFAVELGVFLRTCESVGTVRALTCYLLAESGEWDQYLDLKTPDFESATFPDDYLVTEALRKNPHLKTSYDPMAQAKSSWWKAETQCATTNMILRAYTSGDVSPRSQVTSDVIQRAQRVIADVLGPLTRDKLDDMERNFRFGPGATSVVSGQDVVPSKKYTCTMQVTPRLYPFWRSLVPRSTTDVELRAFSKVTFVPKTSKTHRAIAIEPHMNIYVQLGIGHLLRQRMKRYGLNLDRQATKNRELARLALSNGLATVDLSSASDTIASELVWLLLPFEWAALLDVARTEYSVIDDEEVRLSKFSSMGNGYTFELESLIFFALARASGDSDAVAFGDDIIIKRANFPVLADALEFLGFTVNSSKTFLAGRFFESCGYDYWNGVMVRPFYLKGNYHDFTTGCIRIANKVRRYSHMRNGYYGCDVRFVRVWHYARRACPNSDRTGVPVGFGDDGLIKNFDECCPPRARHGHEGYTATVYRNSVRVIDSGRSLGKLMHVLHRGSSGTQVFKSTDVTEMTRTYQSTAMGTQVVPVWFDVGPWITQAQADIDRPLVTRRALTKPLLEDLFSLRSFLRRDN